MDEQTNNTTHQESDFQSRIAKNLHTVRKSYGYTQEGFADVTGVGSSQISNGEKGLFQIPASRLCQISFNTGIPVLEFFRDIDLRDFEFNGAAFSPWQKEKIFDIIHKVGGSGMSKKQNRHAPRKINKIDKKIGKNIRDARSDKGWSQAKLAKELGVTSGQMCLYERGGNRLPSSKLCRLSQILDVSVLQLLKGIDLPDHKIQKTVLDDKKSSQIIEIIDQATGGKNETIKIVVLNAT